MDLLTKHQYIVAATNYREPNFENENLFFNITHHVLPTHPVEKYRGAFKKKNIIQPNRNISLEQAPKYHDPIHSKNKQKYQQTNPISILYVINL